MKSLLSAAALAVVALGAAAPSQAAITISFVPSATQISINQYVTIGVFINGLGLAVDPLRQVLSGFDMNFVYGSSVLSWQSDSYFFTQLVSSLGLDITGSVAGNQERNDISLASDAQLLAGQTPDTFQLFSFNMKGAGNGTTNFTLGDGLNERLFTGLVPVGSSDPAILTVGVGSVCIGVGTGNCNPTQPPGTVPEPASYALVAMALMAAGAAGRTRRRETAAA